MHQAHSLYQEIKLIARKKKLALKWGRLHALRRMNKDYSLLSSKRLEEAKARSVALNLNSTPSELQFKEVLDMRRVNYVQNYIVVIGRGRYRIADFFLPIGKKVGKSHTLIEIDGGIHEKPSIKRWDDVKDNLTGFVVRRYTNDEVASNRHGIISALISKGMAEARLNDYPLNKSFQLGSLPPIKVKTRYLVT